jgi:hypothetical protein
MVHSPQARAWCTVIFFLSGLASADDSELAETVYPSLPETAVSAEAFAPPGWAVEAQEKGDLNEDGRDDLLIVLKGQNPNNVMTNAPECPGARSWDENPRILAAAFALESGGYELALQNYDLLPRHTDPCFADPLGGATIQDGAIRINLGSFANAGTWFASSWNFAFRYLDKAFRLIEYSTFTIHRATGEFRGLKEDYLSRKFEISSGDFTSEEIRMEQLPSGGDLLTMDEVSSGGLSMEPLELSGEWMQGSE